MGIKRKLSSNTGASIVFALAIFLVSTIISLTLISISLTAAKSSASQLEDEQAYLAVSSAARLLEKQMSSSTVTATYTYDETTSAYSATPSGYTYEKVKGTGDVPTSIQNLMQYVINNNTAADLTIAPTDDDLKYNMGTVTITVTPQLLKNAGSGSDNNLPYNSFKAELKSDETKKQKYSTTMYFYVYASTEVTNTVNAEGKTIPLKKEVTLTWDAYGKNNGK